eukprot:g616.t1
MRLIILLVPIAAGSGFGEKEGDAASLLEEPALTGAAAACESAYSAGFLPSIGEFHDHELLAFVNKSKRTRRKRVAFVLRGDLSRGGQQDGTDEKRQGGIVQQEIVVASHLRNIIHPLEQAGFNVDIFASYYACNEAEKVLALYNEGKQRVVASIAGDIKESYVKAKGPEWQHVFMGVVSYDQGYLIGKALNLLKRHILDNKISYSSLILWRHDFMILKPFNSAQLGSLRTKRFAAQEDVAYTFPWWLFSSVLGVHGRSAMLAESITNMNVVFWDTEFQERSEKQCFPLNSMVSCF